jgi:excinuclease ABC subunit A
MAPKGDKLNFIRIKGARVHNLKNVDVNIPKNKLVVITGLSGSGKSSLAFDTIYAEAERRFVESLSSYARQFLGIRGKPDADSITGLSPAIAIDQKTIAKNPRSTVGTVTEIYDYLRILFAKAGVPHCPSCGGKVEKQNIDQIIRNIFTRAKNRFIFVLAPIIDSKKGEHKKILEDIQKNGFLRVKLDNGLMRIEEALDLTINPRKAHSISILVDRLLIDDNTERARLVESVETALRFGKGVVEVEFPKCGNKDVKIANHENQAFEILRFSENFSCFKCCVSIPALEPRLFSFNSPYGACKGCSGLGHNLKVDPDLVLPNKNLTLAEGAIRPWARASHKIGRQSWYYWQLENLSRSHNFSLNVPLKDLPKKIIDLILFGEFGDADSGSAMPASPTQKRNFEGVIPNLERRWRETESEWTRSEIERYMKNEECGHCGGRRLNPEALAVTIADKNIFEASNLSCLEAQKFFRSLLRKSIFNKEKLKIANPLLKEILTRIQFLINVGLEYLTLARASTTLSGGEAQRVRLATQIGSGLTGVIYILDEPSIGLHPRDNNRLISTLKILRDLGNTVIVVEHDSFMIKEADWILDLGPGAGKHGGEVIFEGDFKKILKSKTLTGGYLSGKKIVTSIGSRLSPLKNKECELEIKGASHNNLKNIDVKIPLGRLVCVSGVSGSGKSSLINDVLGKHLMRHFYGSREEPGKCKAIKGICNIDKAVIIDQSPIGRTPRSNPATYTGAFSLIRDIFSKTREAKVRGYKAGRFSFNVKGGRCEACEGNGVKKIEMHFLPDIYVECEECKGARYNKEALEITYKDLNISQVLNLTCEEALNFFESVPQVENKLKTLVDVGLGYVKFGQPATTLSGGEAQRIKLAAELSKKATGRTLYLLDEPTTGLHFEDIKNLLLVLEKLVQKGNTVVVIEHNLDVLRNADWIIDLGPEGGDKGGFIVAEGAPTEILRNKKSCTGKWLGRFKT